VKDPRNGGINYTWTVYVDEPWNSKKYKGFVEREDGTFDEFEINGVEPTNYDQIDVITETDLTPVQGPLISSTAVPTNAGWGSWAGGFGIRDWEGKDQGWSGGQWIDFHSYQHSDTEPYFDEYGNLLVYIYLFRREVVEEYWCDGCQTYHQEYDDIMYHRGSFSVNENASNVVYDLNTGHHIESYGRPEWEWLRSNTVVMLCFGPDENGNMEKSLRYSDIFYYYEKDDDNGGSSGGGGGGSSPIQKIGDGGVGRYDEVEPGEFIEFDDMVVMLLEVDDEEAALLTGEIIWLEEDDSIWVDGFEVEIQDTDDNNQEVTIDVYDD